MIGRSAVQGHCQDARNRRLPDAAMPAEDVAMRDALLLNCVLERARHVLLPDNVGKTLRTVLSREDLVAHRNLDYKPRAAGGIAPVRSRLQIVAIRIIFLRPYDLMWR